MRVFATNLPLLSNKQFHFASFLQFSSVFRGFVSQSPCDAYKGSINVQLILLELFKKKTSEINFKATWRCRDIRYVGCSFSNHK